MYEEAGVIDSTGLLGDDFWNNPPYFHYFLHAWKGPN